MNLKKKNLLTFFTICFLAHAVLFSSCAMRSGQYVKVSSNDDIERVVQSFQVSKDALMASNENKNLDENSWIFVPMDHGILEKARELSREEEGNSYPSKSLGRKKLFSKFNLEWPVPSSTQITSNFGRRWGRPHDGIDIGAKIGAHIVAALDGVVVYSGREIYGYGNITVIYHPQGIFTVYAHADKNFTKTGQRVFRGQLIATVGMTGRTYGPHLHFEVRKNGEAIDPEKFLAFQDL